MDSVCYNCINILQSMKERKDIANLKEYIKEDIKEYLKNDIKEYLKNDIKEYLNNDIKKDLISTKEITNYSIDPNVLKILNLSEYLYKDTEYKNKLSEEYKGKINRNLMISNIDSVYDKIVDLEIEKSKIKEELLKEKSEIYNEKEQLKNENYYLKERIEELQIENKNLKEQLREKNKKNIKGFQDKMK